MLSWIGRREPLKLTEWPSDMGGQILPTQLKLTEAIARQRISDVRGWLGPPGSKERVPNDLFSDPEFTMIVTPHGRLTIHPSYKRHKFEEKHKIDLDKWWREIDFDQDEGKQAFPAPPAPCQELPDQPHLLLPSVLPARSGETEAPAQPPALEADAAPTPDAGAGPEELPPPATRLAAPAVVELAPGVSELAAAKRRTRRRTVRPKVEAAIQALYSDRRPSRNELSDKDLLAAVVKWMKDDILRCLYPDGVPLHLKRRELDVAVAAQMKADGTTWASLETVRRAFGRRIDKPRRRSKPAGLLHSK
jgi:hypothetical protein